jgi:hypothetical protein
LKVNEPLRVLLKDTLTATLLGENSIQAGFSGFGLMPTIEQFNPGFTNSGNQIAMEKHIGAVGT